MFSKRAPASPVEAGARCVAAPADGRILPRHPTAPFMLILKALLVVLHLVIAVAWFALAVRMQTLSKMAHIPDAKEAGDKTVRGMTVMALLLPFVGLGALFAGGGFDVYGVEYHTSLTLAFVLAGIQLFGVQRVWSGLPERGKPAKLNMWIGIGHLIWLVILLLMLWPQYLRPAFG